jgi:CRISPR/Cas system CSM-associated protein Csm3 (group 7 of RAMP superfamily)
MFGNTSIAGRVRFADALPHSARPSATPQADEKRSDELLIEERNGVAIDRVYGSVAVGPFNYEVVTRGLFLTRILFTNFTLAQLALVGLALRDLGEGRIGIGFGKSRGLGRVSVDWGKLTVRYPLADLRRAAPPLDVLLGVGELAGETVRQTYGLPHADRVTLPDGGRFERDDWSGYQFVAEGSSVQDMFRAAVERLRAEVDHG